MGDWEAAQHADTLAMNKQLIDDIVYLYRIALVGAHNNRIRGTIRDKVLDVAAANGVSNEVREMIDE